MRRRSEKEIRKVRGKWTSRIFLLSLIFLLLGSLQELGALTEMSREEDSEKIGNRQAATRTIQNIQ